MENLYQRVARQFDSLVPFLALAREEGFELIRRDCEVWFRPEQLQTLPDTYREYRCQIAHAAFLLGYSYIEAYLCDVMRAILRRRPAMLPHDRKLTFRDVIERKSYDGLINHMIEKEVLAVFYDSAEGIAKYYTTRLHLPWPSYDQHPAMVVASRLRNCLIHNGAYADARLAEVSEWAVGSAIELAPDDVHLHGEDARDFADQVWRAAVARHLRDGE
jgi:hypothetical protein